jgi:hypothetical protein
MTNPATSPPDIVPRPIPELPIDGAGFGTCLNNLALSAVDANADDVISDVAWPPAGVQVD